MSTQPIQMTADALQQMLHADTFAGYMFGEIETLDSAGRLAAHSTTTYALL